MTAQYLGLESQI